MASIYNDSTTSAYGNSSIEVRSSRRRRRFISSPDEMDKLFEALSIPSPSDPALEVKVVEEDCPYIRQNPNDADILLHPRIQRYLIRALRFHRFSSIYNDVPDMFILGRKGRIYSNIAKCKIERGEGIGCRYMPGINENEVARASVQLYKADAIPAALVIVAHKYGDNETYTGEVGYEKSRGIFEFILAVSRGTDWRAISLKNTTNVPKGRKLLIGISEV